MMLTDQTGSLVSKGSAGVVSARTENGAVWNSLRFIIRVFDDTVTQICTSDDTRQSCEDRLVI